MVNQNKIFSFNIKRQAKNIFPRDVERTVSIGTPYLLTILVLNFEIHSPFYYLLMCLKYCSMYGKQCRSWSDATNYDVWSGFTLFANAYLFQYFKLLRYMYLPDVLGRTGLSKYRRHWTDATECDIWSWYTLFVTHPAVF